MNQYYPSAGGGSSDSRVQRRAVTTLPRSIFSVSVREYDCCPRSLILCTIPATPLELLIAFLHNHILLKAHPHSNTEQYILSKSIFFSHPPYMTVPRIKSTLFRHTTHFLSNPSPISLSNSQIPKPLLALSQPQLQGSCYSPKPDSPIPYSHH